MYIYVYRETERKRETEIAFVAVQLLAALLAFVMREGLNLTSVSCYSCRSVRLS